MNEERKAKFSSLAKRLKAMSEDQKIGIVLGRGIVNVEGKALSLNNMVLLLFQANGTVPTVVGGFKQWKTAGRYVKKGEHGLMIWYPSRNKVEEGEAEELRFFVGTVFDISQTEAK
uniref:N-terminal domain-containing protein n=1 Tax=viral metagenome TaxID=1070528 RepID=A0A6M3LV14_9ZZZZ